MLSKADNEMLTRVGPGTPMGNLMRQYWTPALRSDELPMPDGAPLRIRLLGENLIAFRATSGKIGLIENACPHRGASMFYGRNEEDGLRCLYHGWKFDVTGQCVDQMTEPEDTGFKEKVKAVTYPCLERGGIVWTYMGPRKDPPTLPDLEANMVVAGSVHIGNRMLDCNWFQDLENNMDTSHTGALHHGAVTLEALQDPSSIYYNRPEAKYFVGGMYDRTNSKVKFLLRDTEAGVTYGAYRPAEEDSYYWKLAHWTFPYYTYGTVPPLGGESNFIAFVPLDDYNVMEWSMHKRVGYDQRRIAAEMTQEHRGIPHLPNTTDWLGRFRSGTTQRPDQRPDFGIDREVQRAKPPIHQGFSGIPNGPANQDDAMKWEQGREFGGIVDRSREHLGNTDSGLIRIRRRLLVAAKALRDSGTVPPGVDSPASYRLRSGWIVLPRTVDFWEGTKELRDAFAPEPLAVAPMMS